MTKRYPDDSHHLDSASNVLVLTVDLLVLGFTEHNPNEQHRDAAAAKLYREIAQFCIEKAEAIAAASFASISESNGTHH